MKNSSILFFLMLSLNLNSQVEFLAGGISTQNIGPLTLEITVQLFTPPDSQIDSINICFGDGICKKTGVVTQNLFGSVNILESYFSIIHVYAGQASYTISVNECCWSGESLNTPGFDSSSFLLSREHTFFNPIINGPNNSPISTNSINIINGEFDNVLNFNSAFYDPDGDSLAVNFIAPLGDSIIVNEYQFPDQINPGVNNNFTTESGQIIWDSPQEIGNYHIGYEVNEFRNGVPISLSYGVSLILIQNPTSTQNSFKDKFQIYPNPTKNNIFIEGESFDKLEIYNLLGEKLIIQATATKRIDLSNLPVGVYLLSLFLNEEKYSTLIVKN